MYISKSDYMLFLRHPCWLWIKKHKPELIPPVDASTQAMFNTGHVFEPYAESLFPGTPTKLGFEAFAGFKELIDGTLKAINQGSTLLLQPGIQWDKFFCISDIVEVTEKGKVNLYEIKSSTGVRSDHLYDLAFQKAVLEHNGLKVNKVFVIHVNNQYVRHGEIDPHLLTTISEVTDEVNSLADETVDAMLEAAHIVELADMPDPSPELVNLGSKADWLKIYANIAPSLPPLFIEAAPPTINRAKIQEFLDSVVYPLYFFDYETMQSLVPRFDGHRPYQQIPFQYSLHIIDRPGVETRHLEYVHGECTDPAPVVAEKVIADLGEHGSIVTWNQTFEKSRNKELGRMFPQYTDKLQAINERVVDLMIPFRSKWYDDPRCEGSASIKKVLPVLCPELSYKDLGIQNGENAQQLWMEAVLNQNPELDKDQILSDLRAYCHLDTWAMVRIWEELVKLTTTE